MPDSTPIVAYYGSPPDWGADLQLERDIPVFWLGTIGTKRRKHILERVRADLRDRGVEILIIDGIEDPYVFGRAQNSAEPHENSFEYIATTVGRQFAALFCCGSESRHDCHRTDASSHTFHARCASC
jgi:hypothetical protein